MAVEQNPYDDKKLAEIRADQTDPLVMYLIVRESLNMGVGKIAAQCAHAAQMVLLRFQMLIQNQEALNQNDREKLLNTQVWVGESFRKVVLRADDKEWEKLKQEFDCFVVRDAGLTEVAPNTETVIGLWPMRKSTRPKILQRLQVLK